MYKEKVLLIRCTMKTIEITNGPSREELFDGLRLFAEKRQVSFLIENNGRQSPLSFIMQSIEAEDGSGNCWNLQMVLRLESLRSNIYLQPYHIRMAFAGNSIKAAIVLKTYYSTKTRKGVIKIDE